MSRCALVCVACVAESRVASAGRTRAFTWRVWDGDRVGEEEIQSELAAGREVSAQGSSGAPVLGSSRLCEPSHICLAGVSHEGRTRAAINSTSSGRPPFAPPRSLGPLTSTYTRVPVMSKQAAQAAAQMVRYAGLPSRERERVPASARGGVRLLHDFRPAPLD
jgi:hypothetical protein